MRIGVNTLFLIPGEVGGSETYLRSTLKAMAAGFTDLELALFTNRENDALLRSELGGFPQVRFILLPFRADNRYTRILREQLELPGRARRERLDVLWSPGYTAPILCSCPQVTSILDMQYKTHPEDLPWLARITTHLLVKAAAWRSRRVLAISAFSKEEVVRHTGISPAQVIVSPLAADAHTVAAEDTERVRALLGFDGPYLLVVSNTYPHKNVGSAVNAFGLLETLIPHRLVLVGRPRRGEEAVAAAIGGLPDPARVKRLEWVAEGDLAALYQAADALVHPSLYEGFGLPVLEAMAAGLPVVTGRFGSIPEVGGEACVYVDSRRPEALAEGVASVLKWDAKTRRQHGDAARKRAEGFNWKHTAERTLDALKEAVESSSPRYA